MHGVTSHEAIWLLKMGIEVSLADTGRFQLRIIASPPPEEEEVRKHIGNSRVEVPQFGTFGALRISAHLLKETCTHLLKETRRTSVPIKVL